MGDGQCFAALHGAPPDIVSLALAGMPRGTRLAALEYGLIEQEKPERLVLTELGREVVAAAAARYPEPFADIKLPELLRSIQAAVSHIRADSDVRVAEPQQVQRSLPQVSSESAAPQLIRSATRLVRSGRERLRHQE
ncbi:MAG: hypothetical protein ABSC51_01140 [Gaiellaceae bacterium]